MFKKAQRMNLPIAPSTHVTGSLDRVGDGAPAHKREGNQD
jgi:hypothetical protein